MANVRCPMCSKVNAPDAQICAFCGARLKPLGGPSSPQPPANQPENDEPDWLRGLTGGGSSNAGAESESSFDPTSGAEQNQDADLPDWLARIRGRARVESDPQEETFSTQGAEASGDLPDWISRSVGGTQESVEPAAADEANDDWLARLQAADSLSSAEPSPLRWETPPPAVESSGTTPPFDLGGIAADAEQGADDWMSSFSGWNPDAAQQQQIEPPAAETPARSEELSGFGLTGFLSSLEMTGEEKPPETPPQVESGSGFGLTGFLNSLEAPEETPVESAPEPESNLGGFGLPGFLSNLDEEPQATSMPAETGDDEWGATFASGTQEDLPDWLSGAQPVPTSPASSIPTGTTGDLSNWLASLEGEQPREETPAQPQPPAESLPRWLSTEQENTFTIPEAPEPAQPEQNLPNWLSGISTEPPAAQPAEEVPSLSDDVPDWISGFAQTPTEESAQVPGWLSESDEIPAVEVPVSELPVETPSASTTSPFIDEEVPNWLRDFEAEAPAEGAGVAPLLEADAHPQMQAEADQSFAVDLPDWLGEDAGQPGKPGEGAAVSIPSEELARAELPSWVAAMRPVESVMTGETVVQDTDQYVEKAGPLSGMRGVLPIAENLIRYRKPPIYSIKLHTTEKQRNQAALLDSIIAQESQPLLIPPGRTHAPQLILRILLAVVLVAVLALPNLMGMMGIPFEPLSVPALQPVELEEMYNQINQGAQPGQEYTVLLAFDYEPGFSGEMSAAASPVVSHLMQQNARIVVVSTSPNGPALADRLLRNVAGNSYSLPDRAVNLGFLPGGTVSLLEFVRQPQLAAPATVDGRLAWQETFLSSVDRFQDFNQVIVLTDSAETGRAWVEQVSPLMGDMPLFMVASAQAAPLLTPYLNVGGQEDAGQIDGMVAGLMGGAQYGWFAGQTNSPASDYWASYQIGIVLAIVLVLAGGLVSGIRRLLNRDEKGEA